MLDQEIMDVNELWIFLLLGEFCVLCTLQHAYLVLPDHHHHETR